MRIIFVFLLAVWPHLILGAEGASDANTQFDKLMEEAGQHIKSKDRAELEAFSKALREPAMLAIFLGRLGAYPMPEEDQQAAQAVRWPLTGIKDSFMVVYPLVLRVSVEAHDDAFPQRILMFRQEKQDSPWVITDHFLENSDGSVKEKLTIPSPELLAKAMAVMAADLAKDKDCNDAKK
jgi:hypothetical protein